MNLDRGPIHLYTRNLIWGGGGGVSGHNVVGLMSPV